MEPLQEQHTAHKQMSLQLTDLLGAKPDSERKSSEGSNLSARSNVDRAKNVLKKASTKMNIDGENSTHIKRMLTKLDTKLIKN